MMTWIRAWRDTWRLALALRAITPEVHERVKALVTHYDHKKFTMQTSGEWRRHQVYAQLMNEFPDMKGRHLSLAIEIQKCCG
jgi:hypothetical protein